MTKNVCNTIYHAAHHAYWLLVEDFASQIENEPEINGIPSNHVFIKHYLKKIAFTTLNGFIAIKMLEERKLLQIDITKKQQIELLFDKVPEQVKALFDRDDSSSFLDSLWPKPTTLKQLFEILDTEELASVWNNNEIIGQIYLFFSANNLSFVDDEYLIQFFVDNTLGRIWYEMQQGKTTLIQHWESMITLPNERFPNDDTNRFSDPWIQEAIEGTWTAIPENFNWDQSPAFAHVINGYKLASRLGLGNAGDFANNRVSMAESTGHWEGNALELWICLFYEHRRARHEGDYPTKEYLQLLDTLCQQLRTALIEEAAAGKVFDFLVEKKKTIKRDKKDPRDLQILSPLWGNTNFLRYTANLLFLIYEEAYRDSESPNSELTGRKLQEDYPDIDEFRRTIPHLISSYNFRSANTNSPSCDLDG